MSRVRKILADVLAGFDRAVITLLIRFGERLIVYGRWSSPVTKATGHVSGDALKPYIDALGDYPLPNIWRTNDRR